MRVNMCADLGPFRAQAGHATASSEPGYGRLPKISPSQYRRRERRAAQRAAALAEQFAAGKTAKVSAEKASELAAEKAAAMSESARMKAAEEVATREAAEKVAAAENVEKKDTTEKVMECGNGASTSCFGSQLPGRQSCLNCDGEMSADHQCDELSVEELPPPLPLCLYCCHRGSGTSPVHYFMMCVCSDRDCTCWCYCTEAQLEHKKLVYPGGFGRPGCPVKTVKSVDRPKAKALAEERTLKLSNKPCDNPSCVRDFEEDNARALGQL